MTGWTRDKKPPHNHHPNPDCAACVVYDLAVAAENLLSVPYSPNFGAGGKALKPHLDLGLEQLIRRWTNFLRAGEADVYLAQHRTVKFFAANINCVWCDDPPVAKKEPPRGLTTWKREQREKDTAAQAGKARTEQLRAFTEKSAKEPPKEKPRPTAEQRRDEVMRQRAALKRYAQEKKESDHGTAD